MQCIVNKAQPNITETRVRRTNIQSQVQQSTAVEMGAEGNLKGARTCNRADSILYFTFFFSQNVRLRLSNTVNKNANVTKIEVTTDIKLPLNQINGLP